MRFAVSTTTHRPEDLIRLRDGGICKLFELGIASEKTAHRLLSLLGRDSFISMHCLPFMRRGDEHYVFNPAYDPIEAAQKVDLMMTRARAAKFDYQYYGVHLGLLGKLDDFEQPVVKKLISFEEGVENVKLFRQLVHNDSKILFENTIHIQKERVALGVDQSELETLSKVTPLLLDLGHAAINYETLGRDVRALDLTCLDVRLCHISFIGDDAPLCDHKPYRPGRINHGMLSVLKRLLEGQPDLPVVFEIHRDETSDDFENMERTILQTEAALGDGLLSA